jgi:hypothetical protein
VPLGFYLARSPVWQDRVREVKSPIALRRPRLLAAVCTALPYTFGSQRRGHPHLGRPLGVSNLNESAGGFAGLATLLWLAPLAWSVRSKDPRIGFLAGLGGLGALGAFRVPPVDNLLRALPVIGVTDNRRLVLWVAFALVLLGGLGLDQLQARCRRPRVWLWVAAAVVLLAAALGIGRLEPQLRARAVAHYARSAAAEIKDNAALQRARAEHQVRLTLDFAPRYFALAAAQLLALAALAEGLRRGSIPVRFARSALVVLTLADLLGFGYGLNPAIARGDDRPEPPLIAYLRREVAPPARIIGLGEELPPNVLMRYGLADARNYDSVELARSLAWFAPLYDPRAEARTSRRTITWERVAAARDRLRAASVEAIVAAEAPPEGAFERVDRVGGVWVARLGAAPWATLRSRGGRVAFVKKDAVFRITYDSRRPDVLIVRETYDPGWRAEVDGRPVALGQERATFLAVPVPAGRHTVVLRYAPREVQLAAAASALGLAALVFGLTVPPPLRSTRIIADGLGRTQARELKSALCSSPANH